MKRTFDIILSLVCLLVLMPLFLAVTAAIKASMPGPVFFKQSRIGRHGKSFRIIKFRSMVVNREPVSITLESDRRITPLGRYLRKSKIDELPQLWNILIGQMSFVGPRPDLPGYADQLTGHDRIILSLRPGLTGADSLAYPAEESILANQPNPEMYYNKVLYPEKVRINKEYVLNRSFWGDVKIIWNTFLWLIRK